MAHEQVRTSTWVRAASDVIGDLADLFQKEMRLARAELSQKVSAKLQAGIWMGLAAVLGLVALLLVVEAAVLGLASVGIALHWSCLIVAAAMAAIAGIAFAKGRSDAREELLPQRTIAQIQQDIATTREQLT
jgi:hypothetical protein